MKNRERFLAVCSLGVLLFAAAVTPARADVLRVPVVIGNILQLQASPADKTSVFDYLRNYESTLASGRVDDIVGLYAEFDSSRKADLQDYYQSVVADLVVRLDDVQLTVTGDRADVSFSRTDSFTDRKTGKDYLKTLSIDRRLKRDGSSWRMVLDGKN